MANAAQRRYWTRIVALGCLICGGPAEIAHCHGGSIAERGYTKAKGKKLRYMDWLVLPLCPRHGREPYPTGLDTNVERWERIYGSQVGHVCDLVTLTGVDVWALAVSPKVAA